MVRHSGFWASIVSLGLSVAGIPLLVPESDAKFAAQGFAEVSSKSRELQTSPATGNFLAATSRCEKVDLSSSGGRFWVPPNSVIAIGSLDTTGAPHVVTIENRLADEPSAQFSTFSLDSCGALIPETRSLVFCPDEAVKLAESTSRDNAGPVTDQPEPGDVTGFRLAETAKSRRFLIPHFEQNGVSQVACGASLLGSSHRVSVYMDDALLDLKRSGKGNVEDFHASAETICRMIEFPLLPKISLWIHSVTDLDADGHLSVVITDLDRRQSPEDTPVLGCVRHEDFRDSGSSDFGGDIIYLDYRLPTGDELCSLLAHEITHAAIFSMTLENGIHRTTANQPQIPSWLNEAVAHWVELKFCQTPTGFDQRIHQFEADPGGSPIVSSDSSLSLATRRAGSRVSATLFLQQFLDSPEVVRQLLSRFSTFDQALKSVTSRSFDKLFRDWTVTQARMRKFSRADLKTDRASCLGCLQGSAMKRRVFGTAFFFMDVGDAGQELSIHSDDQAQLQITILTP